MSTHAQYIYVIYASKFKYINSIQLNSQKGHQNECIYRHVQG